MADQGHSAEDDARCKIAPRGWWCSREQGHDGPCAAWPTLLTKIRIRLFRGNFVKGPW